jgi:hypothetical protein
MNMDSALDMTRANTPWRTQRRRRFLDRLLDLKRTNAVAVDVCRGRVATWADDRDLRHFLVFKDTPRIERARTRLRLLVLRSWLETPVTGRDGEDRQ